jgi:PEP-CTERM motif
MMKSEIRVLLGVGLMALGALTTWSNVAIAQVRTTNVQWSNTSPTIDGVVNAGEWAAAGAAQGNWGVLRETETDMDTLGNRFQMMWNANGLYILYQNNQTAWFAGPGSGSPNINFGEDNLNFYFDPNLDNDPNFVDNPDFAVDGYQFAFNQYEGTTISTSADRQGIGYFTEAHINTGFGDQANWNRGGSQVGGAALRDIVVAQTNGAAGGLAEVFMPWSSFDANAFSRPAGDYNFSGVVDAADYVVWRDTLGEVVANPGNGADGDLSGTIDQGDYDFWKSAFGTTGDPTGLHHPFAPSNNDTWFLQIGHISYEDPANFLPVWNWTSSQSFTAHPHAEMTFVGKPGPAAAGAVPEPASLALLAMAAMGLAGFVRRKK